MNANEKNIQHVIDDTLESFDEMKKLKEKNMLGRVDYDYESTRDRKASIVLKGAMFEVHKEYLMQHACNRSSKALEA